MLSYRTQRACAALALMTALGCGDTVSNPNGSDGPTSSTGAGASTESATTQGTATTGVTTGSDTRECRLPTAEELSIDNPGSEAELLFNDVLAEHLERLYEAVGQYASGETPLFRGQLYALEDQTALDRDTRLTLNTTRAVASLSYEDPLDDAPVPEGYVLTAFDPETRQLVRLIQASSDPSLTYVSAIRPFYNSGGLHPTCSDCLLELAGVQDEIWFDLSAHGHYTDTNSTPMQVDVEGRLSRMAVDAITLEDILTASAVQDSPFREIEPRMDAGYVVFDLSDSRVTGKDENGCNIITNYDIEWFVNPSCLLDYGVRNLVIDGPPVDCSQDG